MKKIALVCTIFCAGMLNGMGSQKPQPGHYGLGRGSVPAEVQSIFSTYDDIDDVILAIRVVSLSDEELKQMMNEEYYFTKLAHILADKFKLSTQLIGRKFATLVACQYVMLGDALINYTREKDSNAITQLIIQGADVNYIANPYLTPLIMAVRAEADAPIIQLLLDAGADPKVKSRVGNTVLDYVDVGYRNESQKVEIKKMLQDAINSTSQ